MRTSSPLLLVLVLAPVGCLFEDDSSVQGASESGEPGESVCDNGDRDDSKVERGDMGVEGLVVELGDRSVTLTSWVHKGDSPGDYVGFTVAASDGEAVEYWVKAGEEVHAGTQATWSHPNGTTGSEVPGISNINFCDDGSGDDGGGDDGGGDECPYPGTCDDGDGGDDSDTGGDTGDGDSDGVD